MTVYTVEPERWLRSFSLWQLSLHFVLNLSRQYSSPLQKPAIPIATALDATCGVHIKVAHEDEGADKNETERVCLTQENDVLDYSTNRACRSINIADAAEYLVNAGFVHG
ncbi:hypothetical protein F4803DRAFT_251896 [Xylaria telfairii]|nr:hypothetical protein F4803DRAFT_251896 [Xylaria telfairii]